MTQTTNRRKLTMRFAVVAIAVGMLSPTVSINDNGTTEVSVFNSAQAKKVKHNNVKRNKNVRTNHNVKHHNGGRHNNNYNNNYNNHHDDHTAAKVLGGMAVGAAIAKSTED